MKNEDMESTRYSQLEEKLYSRGLTSDEYYELMELKNPKPIRSWENYEECWDNEDDYSPQMSHQQQVISDRYDMVNRKLERGEIDEDQAAEMRMGA